MITITALTACASAEAQESPPDVSKGAVETALHGYFAALKSQSREAFEGYVTPDFVLYEGGYPVEKERFVEAWDPPRPWQVQYEFSDMEIEVYGDVAALSYVLRWVRDDEVVSYGRETALARRVGGQWRFVRFHSSWFPPPYPMPPSTLDDYVGTYQRCIEGRDPACRQVRLRLENGGLYMVNVDGTPVLAGLRRVEMFPRDEDRFYLETSTSDVKMSRDDRGRVTGLTVWFQGDSFQLDRVEGE